MRCLIWNILLCLLAGNLSGCAVFPWLEPQIQGPPPPDIFMGPPTLPEAIQAINQNTTGVRQLQTESATLTVPNLPGPSLRANLAFESPRHLSFRADIPLIGSHRVLDLGSNQDVFWMWTNDELLGMRIPNAPRSPVYYARHDEFARSIAGTILPFEPIRLVELIGLVSLDPDGQHEGPVPIGNDRLEIRSRIPTPQGDWTRTLRIHRRYGWVLEQHLVDAQGRYLASAHTQDHRYYDQDGVSLPHRIRVQLAPGQPQQFDFEINVTSYLVNQLLGDPAHLWSVPQIEGHPLVNLLEQQPEPKSPNLSSSQPNRQEAPVRDPRIGYRPDYRGLRELR